MNLNEYIEIDNNIRFGKPVIKGTRISVRDILDMLANEMSAEEIMEDFPQITKKIYQHALSMHQTEKNSI